MLFFFILPTRSGDDPKLLRRVALSENWNYDKFEMEIVQLIKEKDLVEIFMFSKNYVAKHRRGTFRKFMFEVLQEIIEYGTMEPSAIEKTLKSIRTARRKMR